MAGEKTSKLNDEAAGIILEALRAGHYRKTAAALAGIHATTFSEWMRREHEPYKSFQSMVLAAEAEAEQTQLSKITESPEPADAKWYLSRKFPDRWAETRRIDVSGRLDMGLKLNADLLRDEHARAAIITLTDAVFASGDSEPDSPSPDSDE
jgi:hypothetical protein